MFSNILLITIMDKLPTYIIAAIAGVAIGLVLTRNKDQAKDVLKPIPAEDFKNNMRKGQLIDLRSEEDFKTKRINGSKNYPKRKILSKNTRLRLDQPVFIYCNDGSYSKRISKKLVKKGYYPVYVLESGFKEWPFSTKSDK